MRYEYKDVFLTTKVDDATLQELEDFYYNIAVELGLEEPYLETYVTSLVYVEIARRNIEGEGFDKKLEVYKQKADEAYKLSKVLIIYPRFS